MTPPQHLINFWPHPHGIVKVHFCVGTQELRERYRLSSAQKIGKRCPMGTENVRAPRGNKNKQTKKRRHRGIKFEKTERLLPFGKLRLTESDLTCGKVIKIAVTDNPLSTECTNCVIPYILFNVLRC